MAKSKRRKGRRVKNKKDIISVLPGEDLISELPQHIRETIVGFLPIRDAVKTSVLSRKWRFCWTKIPHLIFNNEFVERIMDIFIEYDDPEMLAHKLVSVINKILLLHNGPILKFSFSFNEQDFDSHVIHDYINQWIPLFNRKGIKQLALENLWLSKSSTHNFSSLDLTHLKLIQLWFPYAPSFSVFPYLTNLELICVKPTDCVAFEQRILNCPVLEKLALILCKGIHHTNFCAPKLKCLRQFCYDITSKYSLSRFENLKEFSFGLKEGWSTKTSNVLGSLPKIEKFYIAINFLQHLAAGHSLESLSNPLSSLKTLNISNIHFNELSEVSCLLFLIQSAPNLCKLNIFAEFFVYGDLENYQIKDSEGCTMDHLEIVTFSNFNGLRAELELVKFLLARSPLLKKVIIHYSVFIRKHVAVALLKKILQYPTASSKVQFGRLEDPVDFNDLSDYPIYIL